MYLLTFITERQHLCCYAKLCLYWNRLIESVNQKYTLWQAQRVEYGIPIHGYTFALGII